MFRLNPINTLKNSIIQELSKHIEFLVLQQLKQWKLSEDRRFKDFIASTVILKANAIYKLADFLSAGYSSVLVDLSNLHSGDTIRLVRRVRVPSKNEIVLRDYELITIETKSLVPIYTFEEIYTSLGTECTIELVHGRELEVYYEAYVR